VILDVAAYAIIFLFLAAVATVAGALIYYQGKVFAVLLGVFSVSTLVMWAVGRLHL
jgi:hypothetical protein